MHIVYPYLLYCKILALIKNICEFEQSIKCMKSLKAPGMKAFYGLFKFAHTAYRKAFLKCVYDLYLFTHTICSDVPVLKSVPYILYL